MKIIMTDDVMEVSPGVMLFTRERLAEILEFASNGDDLPKHSPTQTPFVDQQVLIDILLDEIDLIGQTETAQEYGISPQYLNDVIRGRRGIGEKLARSLGFKAVRLFKSVPSNSA